MTLGRSSLDRLVAWSPALLLGAMAALTYWLDAQVRTSPSKFDGSGRHDTDLYVENFKADSFDAQGRIRQSLKAKSARHFPDDDTTELESPQITFSDPGKPMLNITSEKATVTGDRENIYFVGKVRGVRDASSPTANDGPSTISSEYLHVIAKDERVETDKPVTIADPRGIISATGMDYDNKTKTIKFRSGVSGQLQPQKQQHP
jgi:lipopolysaccharide export system protein LptC